jgi:uncharacterized protein
VTNHYSNELRDWYLIPMAAAIWSCPTSTMMAYPMATFARFCHNHGLLQIANRPQWYTVAGGSKNYVNQVRDALLDMGCEIKLGAAVSRIDRANNQVTVTDNNNSAVIFDAVVIATHSDQALRMLAQPSANEQRILGAIRYQPNVAVLHTDASVLPSKESAWAAWNYETRAAKVDSADSMAPSGQQVCLHYLLNNLQPLPVPNSEPVVVSLNPLRPLDPAKVLQAFDYDHPVFNAAAIAAQQDLPSIQGQSGIWYAGAWTNYGFHEDGFQSGKQAALQVLDSLRFA